jgi:hypothetical protein
LVRLTFYLTQRRKDAETQSEEGIGSARRWRAIFGGSTKTSCNKFPSAMRRKKWLDEGSGEPPEPARGPRALPTQ